MPRDFSVQNKANIEEVKKKILHVFKLKNKKGLEMMRKTG